MKEQLTREGVLFFSLRVHPGAKKQSLNAIEEKFYRGRATWELAVDIQSPPQDGKANDEVRRFCAELFSLPFQCVTIHTGSKGRIKLILLKSS